MSNGTEERWLKVLEKLTGDRKGAEKALERLKQSADDLGITDFREGIQELTKDIAGDTGLNDFIDDVRSLVFHPFDKD